ALAERFEEIDAVLCPSETVRDDFVKVTGRGPERCHVVYPGRDLSRYRPPRDADERARLRRALGLPIAGPLIVAAGRLSAEKDVPTLLRAFARVAREHSDASLAIVGEGDARGQIEALIDALDLGSRARLLGYRDDVAEVFRAADLFGLTSTREAFGLVVAEAQATGLPAVVTACGGPEEIVADRETGYVVPAGDEGAVAERLNLLLTDPNLRAEMGIAARARAARFDLSAMVGGWRAVYEAALARRA
ncbi:MAG: glycosyltransferase, partial [Myxococcales bacterium]|nr:glycosyltransferase [Myxococcales bacterium]